MLFSLGWSKFEPDLWRPGQAHFEWRQETNVVLYGAVLGGCDWAKAVRLLEISIQGLKEF